MEQLLRAIADDWQMLQDIKRRLPHLVAEAKQGGTPGRHISRTTAIPEPKVRRLIAKAASAAKDVQRPEQGEVAA